MIWLSADGEYLVQGAFHALPDWAAAVRDPDGEPVRPARFYLVTSAGEVRRVFLEPAEFCLDDELVVSDVHAVFEDALICYRVADHVRRGLEIGSRVELAGLRPTESEQAPPGLWAGIGAYDEREQAEGSASGRRRRIGGASMSAANSESRPSFPRSIRRPSPLDGIGIAPARNG